MNEVFTGKVIDLSAQGQGVVVHSSGKRFFVKGVWPGDEGEFVVEKSKKRYGFARLLRLTVPSSDRVHPPCAHQGHLDGQCGACPWMIASYPSQLHFKQSIVEHHFKSLDEHLESSAIKNIWPSSQTFGYRNRAVLKSNGNEVGYVSPQSHHLAPIQDCLILNEKCRSSLKDLLASLPQPEWRLLASERSEPWVSIGIDDSMTGALIDEPLPFRQSNSGQNQKMRDWLDQQTRNESQLDVHELFCGDGNFTGILTQGSHRVLAVEGSSEAVQRLRDRDWKNVFPLTADLYDSQRWSDFRKYVPDPQLLLLDPPRSGFPGLSDYLLCFPSLKQILYISCHLHSLVQDLSRVDSKKWRITEVQPVDQFPHTPHIELLVALKSNNRDGKPQ